MTPVERLPAFSANVASPVTVPPFCDDPRKIASATVPLLIADPVNTTAPVIDPVLVEEPSNTAVATVPVC